MMDPSKGILVCALLILSIFNPVEGMSNMFLWNCKYKNTVYTKLTKKNIGHTLNRVENAEDQEGTR